jgi:hypothetical protein
MIRRERSSSSAFGEIGAAVVPKSGAHADYDTGIAQEYARRGVSTPILDQPRSTSSTAWPPGLGEGAGVTDGLAVDVAADDQDLLLTLASPPAIAAEIPSPAAASAPCCRRTRRRTFEYGVFENDTSS